MQNGADIDSNSVWNEPNAPYYNAKTVKMCLRFFRTFRVSPYCPHGMYKHQNNRNHPGYSVKFIVQMSQSGNMLHQCRTNRICQQTQKKKREMPELEFLL